MFRRSGGNPSNSIHSPLLLKPNQASFSCLFTYFHFKMSERKVLNKYFPPDFDPAKIPRRKQPKDAQQVVRLMAPFSMRCNTCGEYTYKGKKFNARKETVQGEEYFGIKIFRFYIKCPRCSAEITFKTDPKNTGELLGRGRGRGELGFSWRDGDRSILSCILRGDR